MNPEKKNPELRTFAMALYMIAGACAILQFYEATVILGLLLLIVSFLLSKAMKMTAVNTIYASHAEWIGRTLSIGTWFVFPISMGIAIYLIWTSTDIAAIKKSLSATDSDDLGAFMGVVKGYLNKSIPQIAHTTTLTMAPAIFWWVRRCVVGFLAAQKSEPVDYPGSWI